MFFIQFSFMESSLDRLIIGKFEMNGNIGVDEQTEIVDAINRLMAGRNLFILRDKYHKSWICLPVSAHNQKTKSLIFQSNKGFWLTQF